jgi:tetratricopeptide (TPR) repeat protein
MIRLYLKFSIGIATIFFIYAIFFVVQNNFQENYYKRQQALTDSITKQAILKLNNEVVLSIDEKVGNMEKYVNTSQKNLDFWLKLLTFILSILIGYSIFSGLKTREMAKEELVEIRRIREDINREANNAEDRLKIVKDQISQIENNAVHAKKLEEQMTQQLNELGSKSDIVLDEVQKKRLDELISQTKGDIQKSGIEAIKNLYYAKSLKAQDESRWEDVIRLTNSFIDLDESNEMAFFIRGFAFYHLWKSDKGNKSIWDKALKDYNEVIRLNPTNYKCINNRGTLYFDAQYNNEAIIDYTEAIRLDSRKVMYYRNRARAFKGIGKSTEAEQDNAKIKELEDEEKNKLA